jgi:hypothetical protein
MEYIGPVTSVELPYSAFDLEDDLENDSGENDSGFEDDLHPREDDLEYDPGFEDHFPPDDFADLNSLSLTSNSGSFSDHSSYRQCDG